MLASNFERDTAASGPADGVFRGCRFGRNDRGPGRTHKPADVSLWICTAARRLLPPMRAASSNRGELRKQRARKNRRPGNRDGD